MRIDGGFFINDFINKNLRQYTIPVYQRNYVFSPYKLIWNGDYYYVVGYSEKHKSIGSFRVDRIVRCPIILEEEAVQPSKNFDLNVYLNSMFHMYNGERKQIELVCDKMTSWMPSSTSLEKMWKFSQMI